MNFLGNLFGSSIPSIEPKQLYKQLNNGNKPFLLDVREPVEFNESHVAGAVLLPLGKLRLQMEKLPKEQEIVCICASGNRSSTAVRLLRAAGYNATNAKGGMYAWQMANLPTKRGMDHA